MTSRRAFTLIEILVSLAIVAVLSTVVVVTLNPAELLKQARDSNRISDLNTINTALGTFAADVIGGSVGASSTVYVSLPSNNSDCSDLGLPTLTGGWVYKCVTRDNLTKIDGTGWIPVNFQRISFGNPLEKLPIDQKNTTSTGLYYTFVSTGSWWELTAILESAKYGPRMVVDGGASPNAFEQGTNLTLTPTETLDRGVPPGVAAPSITSISPTTAIVGDSGFTLTVNGASFTSSSVVRWGASDKTTSYISASQLTATILAADISATGTVAVTVYDPVKGTSGSSDFAVSAPVVFAAGSWTTDSTGGATQGNGASIVDVGGILYVLVGGGTGFQKYDPVGKTWTTLASTTASVGSGASLVKYDSNTLYAFRGAITSTFWKYTINTNSWTQMASTTANVDYGGSLAYPGTGDYIYATRGGGNTDFWRYSISGDNWSVNGVAEDVGASITEIDGKIYILSGNSTHFRRYDTSSGTWTTLASTTASVGSGASLVKYDSNTLYAFRGAITSTFWKYTINTNSWTQMASTTANVDYGGSLAYPGTGDYIYATRGGGNTDFWRYSISGDNWSSLNVVPFGIFAGSSLAPLGTNLIYTTRGPSGNFAEYNIGTGNWTSKTAAPAYLQGLASLASDGTNVYALEGSATKNFYRYNTGTNNWTTLATTTVSMGDGSFTASKGGIVYSPSTGLFFASSGRAPGNLGSIISYNPATNSWTYPGYGYSPIPFQIYGGSSLVPLNSDKLYTTRGPSGNFAEYKVSTGLWTSKTAAPAYLQGLASLASDGTNVYALEGSATKNFYRYNTGTNNWTTLATTTVSMGDGSFTASKGGIVYCQSQNALFAIPGTSGNILKNSQ